ncbi:ABC-2 type transport system permease protein [Planococcus glaciei]|uniref:ABC transporter permease subunit n=1 Tax=Planococcus glaciei TaxID=459472 RepID=UPI0008876CA4|nr:ABC transporter permease subunit [Planococcus glaciei]SDH01825.1 ABC-2 type transport system permease protein [Planococcus glaciei]
MHKLLQNEWMKLWSRKPTWIMVILLALLIFGSAGITKWNNSVSNANIQETWQDVVSAEREFNQSMLGTSGLSPAQKEFYEGRVAIAEYRLENKVAPFEYTSMQQQVLDSYMLMSIVTLFTVVVAAGIVASEYSQGTIKMLLTRPVKRWKILTSKYITVLVFAILFAVLTVLFSALAGLLFFGIGEGSFLTWNGSEVAAGSYWLEAFKLAALSFASVWIIGTFAFMLGTVLRSSSFAIGLSIFLMFTGIQGVFLLSRYEIVKYYLFTHTDLTQYYTGFMPVTGITMTLSLVVLAAYFAVFMAISYSVFVSRDVMA